MGPEITIYMDPIKMAKRNILQPRNREILDQGYGRFLKQVSKLKTKI